VAREVRPDVVLMDIGMTGMSSFEATRQIRKERPETRVVFLSMYDDEEYLAECVEIGASGYILKESPAEQLLTAIREVQRGGSYLSPRLLSRLVDGFRLLGRSPIRQMRIGALTKREREVLKMLAEGKIREGDRLRLRTQRQDRRGAQVQPYAQTRHPQQGATRTVRNSKEDNPPA